MNASFTAIEGLQALRAQAAERMSNASGELKAKLVEFDKKAAALQGATVPGFFGKPQPGRQAENFSTLNQRFGRILGIADSADAAPTVTAEGVTSELETALKECEARWAELKGKDLSALNQELEREKQPKMDMQKKSGELPSSDDDGDDQP